MKATLALLGLATLLGSATRNARGQTPIKPQEWAARPVADVGNETCPVVGYQGSHPVALVAGARKQIDEGSFTLEPSMVFGKGLIKVEDADTTAQSKMNSGATASGQSHPSYTSFYAKLTSDVDLGDVYMVLVIFEAAPNGVYNHMPMVSLQGAKVGNLTAGKRKTFSADFYPIFSPKSLSWCAAFFSDGVQIRTSNDNDVLSGLLKILDHQNIAHFVRERSSGNHAIEVYRRYHMGFGDALKKKYAGRTVMADLTVDASGVPVSVQVKGEGMQDVTDTLASEFAYWLFIPRISNGQPEPSTLEIPIKF